MHAPSVVFILLGDVHKMKHGSTTKGVLFGKV